MEKKTWEEFRATGMLWWINTILHMFGWAISVEFDDDENIVGANPYRCEFRGFSEKINSQGYIDATKYLKDNVDKLLEEAES